LRARGAGTNWPLPRARPASPSPAPSAHDAAAVRASVPWASRAIVMGREFFSIVTGSMLRKLTAASRSLAPSAEPHRSGPWRTSSRSFPRWKS
jgi:hypothetical protein